MTPHDTSSAMPATQNLSLDQASSFLKMGMTGPPRPVDDLIDRLTQRDGESWLTAALESGPLRGVGRADELLLQGKASIFQLQSIKNNSKTLMKKGGGQDARLAGLAGYFLASAAALLHHRACISSRKSTELHEVFLDLASVAPESYGRLLAQAATMDV